jgi:integrase
MFKANTIIHWDILEKETVDEIIFISQKIADRLKEYIRVENIKAGKRIFPICYEAARAVVKKAGEMMGIQLKPHDLRRHAGHICKPLRGSN